MEIQSVMGSGIEGFHKAVTAIQQSAKEISAQLSSKSPSEANIVNNEVLADVMPNAIEEAVNAYIPGNDNLNNSSLFETSSSQLNEISQSIVNLKVAEYQAKASVEVIKSADESLGTLIDVTA